MDFTCHPAFNQTTQLSGLRNPTSMDTNDSQPTYLRPTAMSKPSTDGSTPVEMFNTGPFGFSDLINMDSNTVSPLDISSSSSVRTESLAGIEATSQSPAFRATSGSALPPLQERMCPLISGDTDTCEPSQCGPNAPCMNFANLPPIEECASIPCMTPPDEVPPTSSSPTNIRTSSRVRRALVTKRSLTTMSSSSSEDKKPAVAPAATRRPQAAGRTTSADRPAPSRLDKKQRAKQAHSLVEKKYRENLNTKLSLLHTTLQNAAYGPRRYNEADSDIDLEDDYDGGDAPAMIKKDFTAGGPAPKFRKSEVLDDAMNYVNQTEVEMRHMETEILRLSDRVKALEKLVKCEDCSLLKRMVQMQVAT